MNKRKGNEKRPYYKLLTKVKAEIESSGTELKWLDSLRSETHFLLDYLQKYSLQEHFFGGSVEFAGRIQTDVGLSDM
jgi:hypothetical protein